MNMSVIKLRDIIISMYLLARCKVGGGNEW